MSDIRQTRACATFCALFHSFEASTGAGIKRKKKNALGLALALKLTTGRFQDMRCLFLPTLMVMFVVVQLVKTRLLC